MSFSTYIKKVRAGYHSAWHSVGAFSDRRSCIGLHKRAATGMLKALDLAAVPFRPGGLWLEKKRMGLMSGMLSELRNEIDRISFPYPQGKFPDPEPNTVTPERNKPVWMTKAVVIAGRNGNGMGKTVYPGLYVFLQKMNDWFLLETSQMTVMPLTEELRSILAPVRDLQKESVEALPPGAGWKLHLNFDYRDKNIVNKIAKILGDLRKFGIISGFKIGRDGGVEAGAPDKEATVYIGHGQTAKRVASYLQRNFPELLLPPEGDTLVDDLILEPLVAGRFDVDKSVVFRQYGLHGVPFLAREASSGEPAREKARKVLEERFGNFFTAGFSEGGTC